MVRGAWCEIFVLRVIARGSVRHTKEKLMIKHMSYPMTRKAITGGFNILAPLRYLIGYPIRKEIDCFTDIVTDVIGESGFTSNQKTVLHILNQINRMRMVTLF